MVFPEICQAVTNTKPPPHFVSSKDFRWQIQVPAQQAFLAQTEIQNSRPEHFTEVSVYRRALKFRVLLRKIKCAHPDAGTPSLMGGLEHSSYCLLGVIQPWVFLKSWEKR